MTQQCPNCSTKVELVQSTPVVIMLCKGCDTFFDASFNTVGDLKNGLDMGKVPSKPSQTRDDDVVVIDETEESPKDVELPAKRTESMLSVLSGGNISSSEFGCPKCGSGMKSMASPVTGNTLYTCQRCGHTGTNYVKK